MVSISEENISGINAHFRKYRIGGVDTFGIILPITRADQKFKEMIFSGYIQMYTGVHSDVSREVFPLNSFIYL